MIAPAEYACGHRGCHSPGMYRFNDGPARATLARMPSVESHRYTPPPPLSTYVECMWSRRGVIPRRKREYSMPTGSIDLVINLRADRIRVFESASDRIGIASRGAIVHGAQTRSFVLDDLQTVHFVGVHFKPGGAALLGLPASELTDQHVGLDDLWGDRALTLREQLLACRTPEDCFAVLERELLTRLSARVLVHPVISSVLRGKGAARVADLQRDSGYSERRFTSLFAQAVGLTPKKYLRIKRLAKVLREISHGHTSLAEVAASNGYADQAHLVHDFRELTGMTPSAYKPSTRSELHMEIRE